jgi:hypothetical protein
MKNLTEQLILVAKSIFKFGDSQRKTLGAGGVITGEVEVAEGDTCSGHHLLELLLLIVLEAVLLLALTLVAGVVPVVVVVLVVGVKLLPLGAIGDEIGGVVALEATPR